MLEIFGTTGTLSAHHLRTADLDAPLGLGDSLPRFSWWLSAPGKDRRQTACRLLLTTVADNATVWDSGRVETGDQALVCPISLRPFCRYRWQVQVWDETSRASTWSKPAAFETGAFSVADWPAPWLARDPAYPQLVHARREFSLPDTTSISAASLFVASGIADFANVSLRMNYFEAFINNRRLGPDIMSPGQIAPEGNRALVRAFDVTTLLHSGTNALGLRFISGKISAALLVHTADGHSGWITPSASWRMTGGGRFVQLWPADGRDEQGGKGEIQDLRLEPDGWARPGYDDSAWTPAPFAVPAAVLGTQHQPLTAHESLPPTSITERQPGTSIVDFGQNSHGFARLRVHGKPGDIVTLRYAENLHPDTRPGIPFERLWGDEDFDRSGPDGSLDWTSARNHGQKEADAQCDVFHLAGKGEEILVPSYSNHGFRYVEVTGLRHPLHADDIRSVVVHSPVLSETRFSCSDPFLQKLHDLARWSMRTNMLSVPTDCPHRERNGWLGDALCVAAAECLLFDSTAFWDKWFTDLCDAQEPDGFLPDLVPFGRRRSRRFDLPWQSAVVLVAWDIWEATGNLPFIRRHYPMMNRWFAHVAALAEADGHLADTCCWGDWVALPEQAATKPFLGNAYFCRSADLLSRLASTLGETADASAFATRASQSRAAIQKHYRRRDPLSYDNGTQSALVHVLHFGLCEPDERPALLASFEADLSTHGRITTGCLGTTNLLPLLSSAGRDDLAYRLISDRERNWGWWITHCEATTGLETWIGERIQSYNHPFLTGSLVTWFYHRPGGIIPSSPGYATVRIAPWFAPGLDECATTVQTPRGLVGTHWKRNPATHTIDLTVTLPVGVTAMVELPDQAPLPLGSGTNTLTIQHTGNFL